MRILFFTHYFPPEGNAPASRTYEMARRWVAAGHRVTVVTGVPNAPNGVVYEGYKNRLCQRENMDGIDVVRVWTYTAANKGTVLRIVNFLSYMKAATLRAVFLPRPDVIIATSPQLFCGWAGVLTKWLKRRPFILEIRDIWPESIVAVGAMRNRRMLAVLEWLERRMYRAATHIVTVGEGYQRRLIEKGVSAEKISIVTNGVDRDTFFPRPPDQVLKAKLGLEDKLVCSYIGTIGLAAGLDVVLRAAGTLRQRGRNDIAFLLVGDGAEREALSRRAGEAGLNNVIFTGRQNKELMPTYLSISDVILVHLRKTDLFTTVLPSKIFEAAAMARPIILGVGGEAARLVEGSGGGVCIEPENDAQLLEQLERLAADPALRERMGRSGHDYVVANYDRDRLAADYLELLRCFAPGPHPAPPHPRPPDG